VALILSRIGKDMDALEADSIDWFGVGETGTIAIPACPPSIRVGPCTVAVDRLLARCPHDQRAS
jgi:hypothetical protein